MNDNTVNPSIGYGILRVKPVSKRSQLTGRNLMRVYLTSRFTRPGPTLPVRVSSSCTMENLYNLIVPFQELMHLPKSSSSLDMIQSCVCLDFREWTALLSDANLYLFHVIKCK